MSGGQLLQSRNRIVTQDKTGFGKRFRVERLADHEGPHTFGIQRLDKGVSVPVVSMYGHKEGLGGVGRPAAVHTDKRDRYIFAGEFASGVLCDLAERIVHVRKQLSCTNVVDFP